ncbi:lipopolysaccharide biosynthesis protein [Fusobacterium sp. MFO224]|uniref:lipopolysaccharide biosynthesis protein n=1 Tax=Fusobacterium sp. MFO224 TaxID=3378070 RepID=UPI0038546251
MEQKLIEKTYKGFKLYCYDSKFLKLGENIVDKNIDIKDEYKISRRNYVVKISYNDEEYILKSSRNEHRIIQRKIMTILKKGEALNTLVNLNRLQDLDIYAKPFLAIVKRKNRMIVESYIVLEYIESEHKFSKENIDEILKIEKKFHDRGVYHGDFNPSNLICTKKGIKIIDTQGKKYSFGDYRHNYDLLTLEYTVYGSIGLKGWYKKDIWFYLAFGIKKFKRLDFIKKINKMRKKIRDKK